MKQWIDIPLSLVILVLLTPLFIVVSVLIFCISPGNVFYSQLRLGKNGRVFKCYKFRSMYLDADERLGELLAINVHLRNEWRENQKLKADPRIFPLGNLLRKFSIDELPQFFNVLIGDLSIVGPRPYMVNQEQQLGACCKKILSINPGITGLWQTSGRSSTTFEKRMELDAIYVDSRTIWLDFKLMIKTIPSVLFGDNAC